jgi:hypothetical protein
MRLSAAMLINTDRRPKPNAEYEEVGHGPESNSMLQGCVPLPAMVLLRLDMNYAGTRKYGYIGNP